MHLIKNPYINYNRTINKEEKKHLGERIREVLKKRFIPLSRIKDLKLSQYHWALKKLEEKNSIRIANWCLKWRCRR